MTKREPSVGVYLRALLLWLQSQTIADTEFGEDVRWSRRVRFELLAQPADKHPQILHFVGLRRSPNLAQQMAVGQHLAGMDHQVAQQLEFFRRQLDLLAGAGHLPA